MTLDEFKESVATQEEPTSVSSPLLALWHDAQGNWERAHDYAQQQSDAESAWVHAYLHRKEGDLTNANYWYVRAGRTLPEVRLEEEWQEIVATLMNRES